MHRTDLLDGRVDLLALLQAIDEYILIKKDVLFPRYAVGADIDLLVFDREEALRRVVEYYRHLLSSNAELRVVDTSWHCHADFVFDGMLDLRVDLIDRFDFFQNIAIKPSYVTKLFMDRQVISYGSQTVFVPCQEDDLTLRYFEYLEWFDRRPDKIKHLDHICAVDDDDLKTRFFANTHRYIQFKRKTWPGSVPAAARPGFEPQSRREAARAVIVGLRFMVVATALKWRQRFRSKGSG